jgi:chemotaxis protein MotB
MTSKEPYDEDAPLPSQEEVRPWDEDIVALGSSRAPYQGLAQSAGGESRQEDEAWVLTYIDVLTLLLTLFVVLLYLAKNDATKFHQFSDSVGLELGAAPRQPNIIPDIHTGLPSKPAPRRDAKTAVENLGEQLLANIKEQGLDDSMAVMVSKSQVELRINENILFGSGAAELLPVGEDIISKLAGLLATEGSLISVEGHTDNIPIHTARFPSNWELSASRASVVVQELIRHGIPARHLRAVGYADTRPVASNLTAAGRARNRRVSLLIQMEQATPRK